MCVCVCVCVRVQSQVDEVIDVMQENISKVIERGERLEDLQDKSGDLEGTSFWTSTLHILGVIQMPRTPAFRVASGEISQLSCGISRRHAPFWSSSETMGAFTSRLAFHTVTMLLIDKSKRIVGDRLQGNECVRT